MAKRWHSPAAKAKKFLQELSWGKKITHEGEFKSKDGKDIILNDKETAYRAGYVDAVAEGQRIYAYKHATAAERKAYREKRKANRKSWR